MGCCSTTYLLYGIGIIAIYLGIKFVKKILLQRKLDRWKSTPKDVVIVHGFPPATTLPNASPFVMKVLTYLRMANINYKIDVNDAFGPKGKVPWISLNGQHISDSHFIVKFLKKKFEQSFNGSYSEEQLAIATTIRVMLEEHTFWGMAMDRFLFTKNVSKIMKVNAIYLAIMTIVLKWKVKKGSQSQGIGRHSEEEVVELITKDIRAVSKILGNKKFILGDEPCEDDCAIFGILSQLVWGLPGSPYEKLLNTEFKNLKDYCFRMKDKFWADWDYCLGK